MYAVYAWNLFVWRVERIAVLVYVKNVGRRRKYIAKDDHTGIHFRIN
jgi:hypothetical protein